MVKYRIGVMGSRGLNMYWQNSSFLYYNYSYQKSQKGAQQILFLNAQNTLLFVFK